MGIRDDQRGFGFVELLLVLVFVAIASTVLYKYVASTARTLETLQEQRPAGGAKVAADQATLGSIRVAVQTYYAQQGQWPADKAAVLALFNSPPRFQCPGNDFAYEPAAGDVRLLISDPTRC